MVSIHAPARGATLLRVVQAQQRYVSIHAPARGATCSKHMVFPPLGCFNPRSRTGSDWISAELSGARNCFNPRSRTGSDQSAPYWVAVYIPFQSTLPHGERLGADKEPATFGVFQSTLPHGERPPLNLQDRDRVGSFNPRSRTGSDTARSSSDWGEPVSIHAPARGATQPAKQWFITTSKFQSTLPHGERPLEPIETWSTPSVSIHAPARGATLLPGQTLDKSLCFNPRSRTGSDRPGHG